MTSRKQGFLQPEVPVVEKIQREVAPKNRRRLYLLTLRATIAIFVFMVVTYRHQTSWDTCMYDRSLAVTHKYFPLITTISFNTTVGSVYVFMILLLLWNQDKKYSFVPKSETVFSVVFTILWYCFTFLACVSGREFLADHACSTKANSISGHFTFHVFYFLTLPYLYYTIVMQGKIQGPTTVRKTGFKPSYNSRNLEIALIAVYVVYTVSSGITLYRTWTFGFHSARQIIYGTFLAVLSNYILVELLALVNNPRFGRWGSAFLVVVLTFGLVLASITVANYEASAFARFEIGFFAFCWVIAAAHSYIRFNSKEKLN